MPRPSAWLYMRGPDAVRVVVDGRSVAVFGPGRSIRRVDLPDEMDAVLYQASVERALLTGGWILERRLPDASSQPGCFCVSSRECPS